ncbi:hypothetical protein [Pseudodesulfovibrio sp. zrk46]|uniref:hypothetical protein n=1 Tax=Pseudodesulfovibrio sp. zrk46 TaxID=2725288 RepID=UPI001449CD27|nr:hypothetical protein [Pseudodesulfovibrio sp. zrk46]QJB57037.1 hypothetical protein HFN16_11780 [Pseudodesulfovibrio sp. zrk46]
MQNPDQSVSLQFSAETRFIPLVQGVVEHSAKAFELDAAKSLRLTMAAEEIVSHLVQTARGTEVKVSLSTRRWCVLADFSFEANPSDLWAMNLAAKERVGGEQSIEHLGLLLASRMVDGFSIRLQGKIVHLELRQDHAYPTIEAQPGTQGKLTGALSIAENPEPALIKEACTLAVNNYPAYLINQVLFTPGKVVDMVAQGDLDMAICVDEIGTLAGIMVWRSPSEKSVSFSGPYILTGESEVADLLEQHLLSIVSRTQAVSLFSDLATPDMTPLNYEHLGRLDFTQADNQDKALDIWFRHLREDMGAAVWTHPTVRTFLEETYDRLVLMRTIREVDNAGEGVPDNSVFSAQLRPELKEAVLSPMVVGADVSEAVKSHLDCLKQDGYENILFHLDLAYGWQASMGGVLCEHGFSPTILLPHGGISDVVVFRHG